MTMIEPPLEFTTEQDVDVSGRVPPIDGPTRPQNSPKQGRYFGDECSATTGRAPCHSQLLGVLPINQERAKNLPAVSSRTMTVPGQRTTLISNQKNFPKPA